MCACCLHKHRVLAAPLELPILMPEWPGTTAQECRLKCLAIAWHGCGFRCAASGLKQPQTNTRPGTCEFHHSA